MKYVVKGLTQALYDEDVSVIAHCANCFNTMKSGVAKSIVADYPTAELADKRTIKGDHSKMGHFTQVYNSITEQYIFNLYGQYNYGTDSVKVDYSMLTRAMTGMAIFLQGKNITSIGLPKLGCGLAGGDWDKVVSIIESTLETRGFDVTIYVLDEKEIPSVN